MSQLDFLVYWPLVFFSICMFNITWTLINWFLQENLYENLRGRSLFLQGLGIFVFEGAGSLYLLKNFISSKLFVYRSNEYYVYLCKKIK